jgi:lipopolysaccharide transport system permease protein
VQAERIVREFEVTPKTDLSFNLKEIWDSRELIFILSWRDIKVKYKQTVLGLGWVILQPLALMLVFTFFFRRTLGQTGNSIPYEAHVLSGLLLWNLFSTGISNSSQSMLNNANVIKKVYFPRIIIPVSSIIVSIIDFFVSSLLIIPVFFIYDLPLPGITGFFMIIAAFFIAICATLGPGIMLSALNIKYRDFRYILPFMLQVLLFLTPVIYRDNFITNPIMRSVLAFNPLNAAISLFRAGLFGAPIDPTQLAISLVSSIFFLLIGLFIFNRTEKYFADLA